MINTCGIFLIDGNNDVLLTHPTNAPPNFWSIPKGCMEPCESPLIAAWREMKEETGICRSDVTLNGRRCVTRYFLGSVDYIEKPKRLIAYMYKFTGIIDKKLVCNSTFGEDNLPENDGFMWIHYVNAYKYVNYTQKIMFKRAIELGIL